MKNKRTATTLLALLLLGGAVHLDAQNRVVYPYTMNPTEHPDYLRHYVKAPDISVFDNKLQFTGLRNLSLDNYKECLDRWVDKNKQGNFLWATYNVLYQKNLKEIVAEIKKRNLYLFDVSGFVPGSGPNGFWQQFVLPDGVLDFLDKELGDHWLGMDNGEQDGRYIGSFEPSLYPMGADRKQQYFNFQRHFQEMGDQLGNKLATLVSLNYGHYFLKEGIYTLIGAETAQGLPNSQIYYSFIRGAGKQYGVHWFGNASIWNRWGFKVYKKKNIKDEDLNAFGSPLNGTSLSLLKRLIYTQMFYNCVLVGFEGGQELENNSLSPIGEIQKNAVLWSEKYKSPGTMYTPVAFMTDFFAGWTFPRHLYSGEAYRVWGNLPYEKSDYLTDNLLDIIYPGYQDASYYHNESGFIAPTPYGDMADCLMSDAPSWLLKQYPLLVIADELRPDIEVKEKLERYVQEGGHLVITSGSLKNMKNGLLGISACNTRILNAEVSYKGKSIREKGDFALAELKMPEKAIVVETCNDLPAIVEMNEGKGKMTVIASPFAVNEQPQCKLPARIYEDKPLDKPYPMLNHVKAYLEDLFAGYSLFEVDPSLSLVTCVKDKNEFSVLVTNSSWEPRPLNITSKIGEIESIKEMKINQDELKCFGYTPRYTENKAGKNTSKQIAGGGTRAFLIKVKNPQVTLMDKVPCVPNVTGKALTFRHISNLKEEILSRPTFFEHYDRAVIDWRYVDEKSKDCLSDESGWLGRQKLKISVDLTSGLNLFPDLRLVNNDGPVYKKSMERIKSVIDKMQLLGADELIISSHRMVENNYSGQEFNTSLIQTYQMLADYAKERNIHVLFRPYYGRMNSDVASAIQLTKSVKRDNFYLAPTVAMLLDASVNIDKNIKALKDFGIKYLIWAAPERDINKQLYNLNKPVYKYENKDLLNKVIGAFPGCQNIMDGIYTSWDDEYLDAKVILE